MDSDKTDKVSKTNLEAFFSVLIIDLTFLLVTQHFVSSCDFLEGSLVTALVRMVLNGKFPTSPKLPDNKHRGATPHKKSARILHLYAFLMSESEQSLGSSRMS